MESKKPKILIVEDDRDTRNMYIEVFKKNGFEVEGAINGALGLEATTKNIFDIIFTGIMMPRMTGFELIENLKKNPATSNIPVVISSHMDRDEDRERAIKLGAKDFIVRSFVTPHKAMERIRALFDLNAYRLKIIKSELDAERLAVSLHLKNGMKCSVCNEDLIISLDHPNHDDNSFNAKIICPKCG